MSTSITVRRDLDTQYVPYAVVSCPVDTETRRKGDDLGDISASCVARAMILKDVSGSVMAVIPRFVEKYHIFIGGVPIPICG